MAAISRGWRCIDQSEGSRCRPTNNGIFRKKAASKSSAIRPPDHGSMKQPEREAAFRKTMNFCRSRITLGRSFPGSTLSADGYTVSWHGGRATHAALGRALLLPPTGLTVRSIFESRGFETRQSQNCTTQRGCRTRGWLPEATCGVGRRLLVVPKHQPLGVAS